MPDISKSARIDVSVPRISGAPELTDLAKRTRDAAKGTTELKDELGRLPEAAQRLGSSAKTAFRDITDGANKAKAAVKDLGDEAKKTSNTFLGMDKRMSKTFGKMTGLSGVMGLGRLATAGPAGLAALAIHDVGGMAMKSMYSQKFGAGPLSRDDAGMVLGTISGMADTLTGRKYREEAKERAVEKAFSSGDYATRQSVMERNDQLSQQKLLEPWRFGDQEKARREHLHDLNKEFGRRSAEAARLGDRHNVGMAQYNMGAVGDAKMSLPGQAELVGGMAQAAKLELVERTRLKDILTEQVAIEKEKATALRAGIQGKRSQFANMDQLSRMSAKELGGKLQRGEKLTPEEMEAADGLGILRPLVQKRKEQDSEEQFVGFLKEAGNDQERKAAGQAQEANGVIGIEGFLKFDEDQLQKTIGKMLEDNDRNLRNAMARIEQAEVLRKNLNDRLQRQKDANFEQE